MGLPDNISIYEGKRVLITGHTGFKGSWLSLWLNDLGAEVHGYALPPPTVPSLFDALKLADLVDHNVGDIRDFGRLEKVIARVRPDIIFHLAAQSVVRDSYSAPLETAAVNALGTVNLMEAVRQLRLPMSMVMITSDKCYENREWLHSYRETDALGGHDPYSASKAAAEIFINSWRDSFFPPAFIPSHGVRLASARAGNVVGGGDWTKDNLVPDCVRAFQSNTAIELRNPGATRPWQHVLEALGGYLHLGARLLGADAKEVAAYCGPFNFGPAVNSNRTVKELVQRMIALWGHGFWKDVSSPHDVHEASLLSISIDKAYHLLQWYPKLDFEETLRQTVDWYRNPLSDYRALRDLTLGQIRAYQTRERRLQHAPTENVISN